MQVVKEEWVELTKAAEIVRVSTTKLSRMVHAGELKFKRDPRDKRKVLLNLAELRRMFPD